MISYASRPPIDKVPMDEESEGGKAEKEKRAKMDDHSKTSLAILLQNEIHMSLVSSPSLVRFLIEKILESRSQHAFSRLIHLAIVLLKVCKYFGPR